jgi:hypothetical protein
MMALTDSTGVDPRAVPPRLQPQSIWFCLTLGCVLTACSWSSASALPAQLPERAVDRNDQHFYTNAHPYLEDTIEQIILQLPELKSLRPAADQQALPSILDKTGATVQEFFQTFASVIAREKIVEERFNEKGKSVDRSEVQDDYLILRRGDDRQGSLDEYRMDSHGNRLAQIGLDRGFFVTSNFALSAIYFLPEHQSNSKFRYLGDARLGGRDTYVVAFAQQPGQTSLPITLQGRWGASPYLVHLLVQGVAWIDKENSQIRQIRTDLLAPRRDIGLLRLTTELIYSEQQLAGAPSSIWLVSDVKVYAHFSRFERTSDSYVVYESVFRNHHQLTDYRRFGVSAKVGADVVTAKQSEPNGVGIEDDSPSYLRAPDEISSGDTQTYVDEPVEQLTKRMSQLKSLRPAPGQDLLPAILRNTGARVDAFLTNIVDLTAHEKITQARVDNLGHVIASENTQDNYLIVHRSGGTGGIEEYRTDATGNRPDSRSLNSGYFITSGFALNCNYFSTSFQPESSFRYLGMQKIGGREAYVVAFVQSPGRATLAVTLRGRDGTAAHMLVQGIAWIDQETSQILRLRSDLLVPLYSIGLNELITEVNFSAVQLQDMTTPLWLPKEVSVRIFMSQYSYQNADYYEQIYRNEHRYADYRRFRVSVKLGP